MKALILAETDKLVGDPAAMSWSRVNLFCEKVFIGLGEYQQVWLDGNRLTARIVVISLLLQSFEPSRYLSR